MFGKLLFFCEVIFLFRSKSCEPQLSIRDGTLNGSVKMEASLDIDVNEDYHCTILLQVVHGCVRVSKIVSAVPHKRSPYDNYLFLDTHRHHSAILDESVRNLWYAGVHAAGKNLVCPRIVLYYSGLSQPRLVLQDHTRVQKSDLEHSNMWRG